MTKVLKVEGFDEVRQIRDSAWNKNAEIWSDSRKLPDKLKEYIYKSIKKDLNSSESLLVDLGCGNAWLLEYLVNIKNLSTRYLGVDLNHFFLQENIEKYKNQEFVNFKFLDLEKNNSLGLKSFKGNNLFIACLSLIETPDLRQVFINISREMKPSESLLIIILDPYFEILRMSQNLDIFKKNVLNFLSNKKSFYKKEIIIENGLILKKKYIGLLHKIEDYYLNALNNDLSVTNDDIIDCYNQKTKKGTIYRVLKFTKNV